MLSSNLSPAGVHESMYRAVLSVISYEKRELSDINTYKTVSEYLRSMIKARHFIENKPNVQIYTIIILKNTQIVNRLCRITAMITIIV